MSSALQRACATRKTGTITSGVQTYKIRSRQLSRIHKLGFRAAASPAGTVCGCENAVTYCMPLGELSFSQTDWKIKLGLARQIARVAQVANFRKRSVRRHSLRLHRLYQGVEAGSIPRIGTPSREHLWELLVRRRHAQCLEYSSVRSAMFIASLPKYRRSSAGAACSTFQTHSTGLKI